MRLLIRALLAGIALLWPGGGDRATSSRSAISMTEQEGNMVTLAEFSALAAAHGVELRPDGDVIVASGDTLNKLVDLVEDQGLVILGLDGFEIDGAVVVPLLNFIADFSSIEGPWASRVHASASATRDVCRDWGPTPDLVEVTLGGLSE